MDSNNDPSEDRIPLIEVTCPDCGAKILVPKCVDIEMILCPCCCPITPNTCFD